MSTEKRSLLNKSQKQSIDATLDQHTRSGCSPVFHEAKEPNVQQAEDLQTELELDQLPWWKYLVKTQIAGHLATDHY